MGTTCSLKKAASLAMQQLAEHPVHDTAKPPYPNYLKK
jgi:hypothetical protein